MENIKDRFLRYVAVDTQSDESSDSQPSAKKELILLEMLRDELSATNSARWESAQSLTSGAT